MKQGLGLEKETIARTYMMEEEIDLREYVEVLLRYWKWIAGCALLAAVTAFIVSLLMPPTYEASAVVLITQPRYQMQFDSRFETVDQWSPAYKAFPTLATSDDILQEVVEVYTPSPQAGIEEWKARVLKGMVEATSEGDPSLLMLKVSSRSAEDAAGIANAWAKTLVQRGNEIYSGSQQDLAFFEKQSAQAKEALNKAEAALVDFQARNQASIIKAQLNSVRQMQSDYLADQRSITYIVQDIRGLRAQLAQRASGEPLSFADDLTTLFLQIKAFNAQASPTIQLQINSPDAFSNKSWREQIAFLDNLADTLESKSAEIDERLAELEPRMLELQERLQEIETEQERLTRAKDLAQETYLTLARKLEEARVAAQEKDSVLQMGSRAAMPENPVGPRKKLNTAIAGALGLMLGVFGAFAIAWWREDEIEG